MFLNFLNFQILSVILMVLFCSDFLSSSTLCRKFTSHLLKTVTKTELQARSSYFMRAGAHADVFHYHLSFENSLLAISATTATQLFCDMVADTNFRLFFSEFVFALLILH